MMIATKANRDALVTILGFGSLMSERSSRLTFPELQNFRLAHVPNFRRVYAHPASIFFQRGIANKKTLEMASLSVEPCQGHGLVAAVFEVPNTLMMADGIPSREFLEREEEFDIVEVPYQELDESVDTKVGVICARSTDEAYLQRWGKERFDQQYSKYGIDTIWNWSKDSGLRPCAVYLRHCYLAAESMGEKCLNSFLDC